MLGFNRNIAQRLQETENVVNELPEYRPRVCTTGLTRAEQRVTEGSKGSLQKKSFIKPGRELITRAVHKIYYSYGWKNAVRVVAGTYGVIFKVERANIATKEKRDVAVKALKVKKLAKDEKPDTRETVALAFLKNNRHDNIIEFYGCFQSSNRHVFKGRSHTCLVFQFIDGDLDDLIKAMTPGSRLSEYTIQLIAKQALEGLVFLHKNRFVHRDIKPDNLMIDKNYRVRITDFGLTEKMPENVSFIETDGYSGTIEYISPEEWDCKLAYVSDVWAIGVILYLLCSCGDLPWEVPEGSSTSTDEKQNCSDEESHSDLGGEEVRELIQTTEPEWDDAAWDKYPEVKGLVVKLLIKDYTKRPTADASLLEPLFSYYQGHRESSGTKAQSIV